MTETVIPNYSNFPVIRFTQKRVFTAVCECNDCYCYMYVRIRIRLRHPFRLSSLEPSPAAQLSSPHRASARTRKVHGRTDAWSPLSREQAWMAFKRYYLSVLATVADLEQAVERRLINEPQSTRGNNSVEITDATDLDLNHQSAGQRATSAIMPHPWRGDHRGIHILAKCNAYTIKYEKFNARTKTDG